MNPREIAARSRHYAAQLIRAAISPRADGRPTLAEIAAQTDRAPAPRPTPAARRPAAQWFCELEEHFPRAYLHAYASDLDQLRDVCGCSPAEAASYARTHWLAPFVAEGATIYSPPVTD